MNKAVVLIIAFFFQSFLMGQKTDSLSAVSDNELIAKCTGELNPNKAITYFREIEKRNIDEDKLPQVYLSAGDAFFYLQDYKKAESYFLKSYGLTKNEKKTPNLPIVILNLAEISYRLEKYPLSEKYFQEYKNIFQTTPESPLSTLTEMDYWRVYFLNGDFETYLSKLEKSYQYFLKQEEINQDPKLLPNFLMAKTTILFTMANTATLMKKGDLATQYINQARSLLNLNSSSSPLYNSYQMGQIYIAEINFAQLNNRQEDALLQSSKLLDYAEKGHFKDYRFIALVKKANILFDEKKYEQALTAAETALKNKASTYDFFNYELEAYRMAYLSAKALNKDDDAMKYAQLYLEKNHKVLNDKKRIVLSKVLNDGEKFDIEKQLNNQRTDNFWMRWGLASAALVLALMLGFLFYRNKIHKENYKKFQDIISAYQNAEERKKTSVNQKDTSPKIKNADDAEIISDEKNLNLLKKLEDFEKTTVYTNQEMSAAYLAAYLKTNTGTLSEVINRYKGTNFNDYINKLRIDFIIEKLQSEKKFRTYKISYLAEVSGFSSHSLFSVVFKKRTGISPSKFIEFLEK